MGFADRTGQRSYVKILQWAIVAAIFFFLGKMVRENWLQVKEAAFAFRGPPLVLGTLIFAFSYFVQIWGWHVITQKVRVAVPFRDTAKGWLYSQLGKYLPGKVWLLLSRFYYYESRRKSAKAVSIALYFETIAVLMAACAVFLVSLLFFQPAGSLREENRLVWLGPLFLLGFVGIHPRVLESLLNRILVRFGREPVSLPISYPEILWVVFIFILSWIVGGMGFYLFVDSVFPISWEHLIFLTGSLAASTLLGLIALFAPGGLGVREGVLVYLLSFLMPGSVAVIISILTRLWMTLVEMGLIGVVYLFDRFREGGKRKADGEA